MLLSKSWARAAILGMTVLLITGIGLKTLEALGWPQPTHRIYPAVEEVDAIFDEPPVIEIPEHVEA